MLRYFYEKRPDIYVIAAGSLLENVIDRKISFPVGRVEYMALHPCSFLEYLNGIGEDFDRQAIENLKADAIHDRLMYEFRKYCIVGGMPAAVKADACRPLLPADLPCAVSAGLFCGVPRYNRMLPDPWFALLLTQRLLPFSIFPKLSGGRTGCAGSLPVPDCLLQWVCG